ncbi:hypothetical protein [Tenacibaculum sp. 190524A05c]|uniref:hypothetical protein n=1 Tax=Tenacibaculum platacis TaxID=3137852 RepID=UPI0031FB4DDD
MRRKRNKIKNIANGILNSFISRNNDIGGYWGIGKLYYLMLKNESNTIEINLIEQIINPEGGEFNIMVSNYSNLFFEKMKEKNIDKKVIKELKIILKSSINLNEPYLLNKIDCSIYFMDISDNEFSLDKSVMCRKHNPKLELKRFI